MKIENKIAIGCIVQWYEVEIVGFYIESLLQAIEGVDNKIAKILEESGISLVSDLLDSDMDSLLNLKGVDDDALDSIYESVQNYVERKVQPQNEEEEIDLSSLGIDLKLDNNSDSNPESKLEKSISEEE